MKNISRRPFVVLLFAYSAGIVFEYFCHIKIDVLFLAAFLVLLASFFMLEKRVLSSFSILVAVFLVGAILAFPLRLFERDNIVYEYRFHRKAPVVVDGVVVSDVLKAPFFNGTKISFALKVKKVEVPWGWKKCSGKVLVNLFNGQLVSYGDRLIIKGRLHYPFEFDKNGKFSYKKYLKRRKIDLILSVSKQNRVFLVSKNNANIIKSVAIKIRNKLRDQLYIYLTDNEASIVKAMLLGDRTAMPENIKTLFERTGIVHILAISGLHVGIIAGLCLLVLNSILSLRGYRYLCTCIFLLGYCFLTGARPSAMRATIMIIVVLMSYVFEKETDVFNTVCFAAFLILLFNPLFLFDVGFQLSFVCVGAIFLFSSMSADKEKENTKTRKCHFLKYVKKAFNISLSVWLGVAGLIAYYFQIITPITIFANILILPIVGMIVSLGCTLLFFAQFSANISVYVALCLKVLLNLMVGIIFLLDKIPYSSIYLKDAGVGFLLGYYIFLFLGYGLLKWKKKKTGIL